MDKLKLETHVKNGLSSYQIGKLENKSPTNVRKWLKVHGLETNPILCTHALSDEARANLKEIRRKKKLARLHSIDWASIQKAHDEEKLGWRELSKKFHVLQVDISFAAKHGLFKSRTQSEANQLAHDSGKYDYSIYKTDEFRRKQSKCGGYKPHSGRSRGAYLNNLKGEQFWLQSSYETRLGEVLNELDIYWIRPDGIKYTLDGINKRYFPDFYLPDYNIYFDPKNSYLIKLDARKIEAVKAQAKIDLFVLGNEQISKGYIASILKQFLEQSDEPCSSQADT